MTDAERSPDRKPLHTRGLALTEDLPEDEVWPRGCPYCKNKKSYEDRGGRSIGVRAIKAALSFFRMRLFTRGLRSLPFVEGRRNRLLGLYLLGNLPDAQAEAVAERTLRIRLKKRKRSITWETLRRGSEVIERRITRGSRIEESERVPVDHTIRWFTEGKCGGEWLGQFVSQHYKPCKTHKEVFQLNFVQWPSEGKKHHRHVDPSAKKVESSLEPSDDDEVLRVLLEGIERHADPSAFLNRIIRFLENYRSRKGPGR